MLSRFVEMLVLRACRLSRRDWRAVEGGIDAGAVLGVEKKSNGTGWTGVVFSLLPTWLVRLPGADAPKRVDESRKCCDRRYGVSAEYEVGGG